MLGGARLSGLPLTRAEAMQVLREDKLLAGCQRYIGESLGPAFTQGQPWTLDGVLPDTIALTPIIFILTSGADPTAMLQVTTNPIRHSLILNLS